MILSANCTRAVPGKFEQYGEVMQDFMAAMMEQGMTPSMKGAEVGAQDVASGQARIWKNERRDA